MINQTEEAEDLQYTGSSDPGEVTISMKNVLRSLLRNLWLIILLTILGAGAVFAIDLSGYSPVYKSSGMLYLQPKEYMVDENGKIGTIDKKVLTNLCRLMVQDSILEKAAEESGYASAKSLKENVTVEISGDSDLITVSVDAPSANSALKAAVSILDSAKELVAADLDFMSASIIQSPTAASSSATEFSKKGIILGGAAGFGAGLLIALAIGLKDRRMQSTQEVEYYLGKPVYGTLPVRSKKGK